MRIQSISDNQFKQVIQLHTYLWYITVSYFFSEILRIRGNGKGRNLDNFFFKKLTKMSPPNCKIHGKNFI